MSAPHPTDALLRAYGLGKLDATTADTVDTHLTACGDCRERMTGLSADSFVQRMQAAAGGGRTTVQWTPPPADPADETAAALAAGGQYTDVRPLGQGGMGVVYLARNVRLNRPEVLKVVGRHLLDKPGAGDRFVREMQAAAKLAHPNIVAAHAAPEFGGLLVFAMEYAPGEDLARVVKQKGPLKVATACYYVYQVALGLQHAHERGMVHRDIKPSNLILTQEGKKRTVKILDFGLAKAKNETASRRDLTGTGMMLGTPDYMAPEQTVDAAAADIRADIYALGGTLWFLLTGKPPFAATNLLDLLLCHRESPPPPLETVRADAPPGLADVLAKMLAKRPADRYATPVEVAAALVPFFRTVPKDGTDTGVSAVGPAPSLDPRPAPAPQPLQPKPAPVRRRWPAAVVGLLLAGAAGLFGVTLLLKTKDGTLRVTTNEPDAELLVDGQAVTVQWKDGQTAEVRVKPGTRKVEVRKDGFVAFGEDVTVEAGGGKTVTARLVPAAPPARGYVPLFNGTGLTGWEAADGSMGPWAVADGVLVGQGGADRRPGVRPPHANLQTTRDDFRDFRLRLVYRVAGTRTAAVVIRSKGTEPGKDMDGKRFNGVWVALGAESGVPAGSVAVAPVGFHANPDPDVWKRHLGKNLYDLPATDGRVEAVVEAVGPRIKTFVNGHLVRDLTDDTFASGRIGLNRYTTTDARFESIEIEELAPVTAAVLAPKGSEWAGVADVTLADGTRLRSPTTLTFTDRRGAEFRWETRNSRKRATAVTGTIGADGRIYMLTSQSLRPEVGPVGTSGSLTGTVDDRRMVYDWVAALTGERGHVELKRLPDGGAGFDFRGTWRVARAAGPAVTATVDAATVRTADGPAVKYTRDGGLIYVDQPSADEWLVIDPDRPDELTGTFTRGGVTQAVTWTRAARAAGGVPDPARAGRSNGLGANAWAVRNGELVKLNGDASALWFGSPDWADYLFEAEVMVTSSAQGEGIGLMVRHTGGSPADPQRTYWAVSERGRAGLFKWADRTFTILNSPGGEAGGLVLDRWVKWQVRAAGDRLTAHHDGRLLADVRDTALKVGCVGFRAHGSAGRVRNVRVTDPAGAVLWDGLPDPPADRPEPQTLHVFQAADIGQPFGPGHLRLIDGGAIRGAKGQQIPGRWALTADGNRLVFDWPDARGPGGFWTDTYTSADGVTFRGTNNGTPPRRMHGRLSRP